MAVTTLVFVANEAGFFELLEGMDGLVARDLARRAINVESAAKTNASGRPGPNVQTGRLRSSIMYELDRDSQGLLANVGSNVTYAAFVELGTVRSGPFPYLRPALEAAKG